MALIKEDSLIYKRILQICGTSLVSAGFFRGELTLVIEKDSLPGICHGLMGDWELRINFLSDVVGVDSLPALPRFAVVYHLYSITNKIRLRLKVLIDDGETVPSLALLYKSADCAEREVFDMFGIIFTGHPDLKRVYLPQDWEGFPLRKDYPLRGYKDEYNPFGEEKKD